MIEEIEKIMQEINELEELPLKELQELGHFDYLPTDEDAKKLSELLEGRKEELIEEYRNQRQHNWLYKTHYSGM